MFRKANKMRRFRPTIEALEARRLMSVFADFNGDGFDDLAIGVPGEDSGSGRVHVLYGTASGLSSTGNQLWSQDATNVPDTVEAGDRFGSALAGGDFNNDGFADLAIGVPTEDINGVGNAGAVNVLYGSASGLTANVKDKIWYQDANRVREFGETDDHFGSTLASGDFNGDGFSDLAVGVPDEDVGSIIDAGTIQVFFGASSGLVPTNGAQPFTLNTPGIPDVAEELDRFGISLTAGDFNGDGRDDLAIGVPNFVQGDTTDDGGGVCVMYGSATGLTATGSQFWTQDSAGIAGEAEDADGFGNVVAAGDFNGDGRDDLAIGVPFEDVGLIGEQDGLIHVLYGSAAGITATGSDALDQGDAGGNVNFEDQFGYALAAADFNGDAKDDLAIGARTEDVVFADGAGAVNVVFGSSGGISSATGIEIYQEDIGTGDESELFDFFGEFLGAGDFNGNGRADLVIAAQYEDIGTAFNAGRVFVLYGTATSNFSGGQAWDQDSPGIPNSTGDNDNFGGGLDAGGGRSASGDGSGRRDLARLISADLELDSLLTKPNKRRLLNGRR